MTAALILIVMIATGLAVGWCIVAATQWMDAHVGTGWTTAVISVAVAVGVLSLAVLG